MKKQKFDITGMTCSACSSHVEKSVRKLKGMEKVSVNLLTNSMQTEFDEADCSVEQIIQAVEKAGYGAEAAGEYRGGGQQEAAVRNGKPGQNAGQHAGMAAAAGEADGERASRGAAGGKKRAESRSMVAGAAHKSEKAMKRRLLVSIVFWIPLMYVAMYHMFYEWFGLPVPDIVHRTLHGPQNAVSFAFTQLLLLLPILYVNQKYFTNGLRSLWNKSPNMDSLIAIGAGAAVLYGIVAIYQIGYGLGHGDLALVERYSMDIYFESAGTILTLITVGKYLERRSKGKTSEAITRLLDLSPKTALVIREGVEMTVPTEEVLSGDIFLVKPGSLVPVDGVIVEGMSSIDESAITGESIPVEKKAGDSVVSATMNKAGFLKCQATRVGEDTTLSQIIRLVEEASASKAPIARLADSIAGVFVPVVICIALAAMVIWLFAGAGFEFAMSTAIAVLVISCPCALGLATPVAIMVGTGAGARNGILIKSGEALQAAREIDTVVLDKTGTITEGKPRVQAVEIIAEQYTKNQVLSIAAALEKGSEHPLAEAVVNAAYEAGLPIGAVTEFAAEFGRGIRGRAEDKKQYYIGKDAWMTELGISVSDAARQQIRAFAADGKTPLVFANEREVLAVLGVADSVKATSRQAIAAFERLGIKTVMLTGDNRITAQAIQRQLGIPEVVAEVLPEEKAAKIATLQKEGRKVAMIGDGINDAPALAGADVGIAIGAGTDVAVESADIILMKSDLLDAVTVIRLSRAVIRNIKENLFWAFFYNCIGIPVAAGLLYPVWGWKLNPMFGAAAMSLSSIFVVCNALRLRRFRAEKPEEDILQNKEKDLFNQSMIKEDNDMTKTFTVTVEGMSCGHCTARVQKALEALEGVQGVEMSLEEKTAVLTVQDGISEESIRSAVEEAGYEVTGIRQA